MKFHSSLVFIGLLLVLTAAAKPPEGTGASAKAKDQARWNVRVEVVMLAITPGRLIPLLPDLRDPQKIDAAVEELLAAVERKEVILTGYATVNTLDGERATSEATIEKRYPTEFDPGVDPQNKPVEPKPLVDFDHTVPTAFETRNLGVHLEVEPHVSPAGDSIQIDLIPCRVELLGFDNYGSTKAPNAIIQPQISQVRAQAKVVIPTGKRMLLDVHLLTKPENYMEVFILQAWATAVK